MPGNLQSIPPSVIASWPAPNYVNPPRRAWLPAYAGILQAVMTVMLGMRLWLRSQKKAGALGLDDALLIPAFMTATMFTGLIIYGAKDCGLDRHLWDVQPVLLEKTMFAGWLAEIAFLASTCCTKASVLLFYRRLAKEDFDKRWRYAIIGAIAFVGLYGVAFILVLIFNCSPTDAYWKAYAVNYKGSYKCTNTAVLNPLSGALSVFTDWYSVILPVLMLWNMEATTRQKIALNAVFSLGLLVVGAGIARTYYLQLLGSHYDLTWIAFDVYVWADLETQLAIICASAPSLRVFFRRYLSDPLNRALQSTRSISVIRSNNRGSNPAEFAGFVRVQSTRTTPTAGFRNGEDIAMKDVKSSVVTSIDEAESERMEKGHAPRIDVDLRTTSMILD